MKSVKSNFIYTLINTIAGLLFPLISFPYVSRILLADGIGLVSFYSTIISYVVLLTNLGIPIYGIKAIAHVRDNIIETVKTAKEILYLNLTFSIIGYLIVLILSLSVNELQENIPVFILLSSSIILNAIGVPWFFSGIEDFKYVTIRGILVRLVSLIFLFIFVRTKQDIIYYAGYEIFASVGNNVVNFFMFRKHISKQTVGFKDLNFVRHLKPIFNTFIFNLITSIYLKLDITILGFLSHTENVGFYTAASRIAHIFLSLTLALGQATLPRLSSHIGRNDYESFKLLANKSLNFILFISLPLCGGVIVLAPNLVMLLCGDSFGPSIVTVRILSFILISIGLSNLFGLQMLYPQGKINIVNISVAVGATLNLVLNLILIPKYAQNGAAIATIIAESSVTITQLIIGKKLVRIV